MIKALKEVWSVSEFRILEKDEKLTEGDIILTFAKMNRLPNLVLLPVSTSSEVSKYTALAYMHANGFANNNENIDFNLLHLMVGAVNSGLKTIYEDHLFAKGAPFYSAIARAVNARSENIKSKRLIIHNGLEKYFSVKKLRKMNLNLKIVDNEEYLEILNERNTNDYFAYFSYNRFSDVSVINAKSGALIYTKHFINGYSKLKGKALKQIAAHFYL